MNETEKILKEAESEGMIHSYSYEEHIEVSVGGIWAGLFLMGISGLFGYALWTYDNVPRIAEIPYLFVFLPGLFLVVFGIKTYIRNHSTRSK